MPLFSSTSVVWRVPCAHPPTHLPPYLHPFQSDTQYELTFSPQPFSSSVSFSAITMRELSNDDRLPFQIQVHSLTLSPHPFSSSVSFLLLNSIICSGVNCSSCLLALAAPAAAAATATAAGVLLALDRGVSATAPFLCCCWYCAGCWAVAPARPCCCCCCWGCCLLRSCSTAAPAAAAIPATQTAGAKRLLSAQCMETQQEHHQQDLAR